MNPSIRNTIARINLALMHGHSDNIASIRQTVEVDTVGRGELVTTAGMPALFVGRFKASTSTDWTRWTCSDDGAFPSLCAAFDAFVGGKVVAQ